MNSTLFKEWRPSASLILLGKAVFSKPHKFDYKLLCLKRSSKSSFMPNTFVFPGGNISEADSKRDWLKLFESHGLNTHILNKLQPTENVTMIYDHKEDEIPKCISLRISAIRETFEECGILICRGSKFTSSTDESNDLWATYFGGAGIRSWQSKVSKDPSEFFNLCKEFDIYPDLFALKPWCNWLTPSILKKRFNTMFFLAAFCHLPPAYIDETEVQELKWETPDEYIQLHGKDIELPLPQFYEISKLRNISKISSLLQFAHERSTYGCEEYFPLRIKTNDGLYSILPGDDLYSINDALNSTLGFIQELPTSCTKNRILDNGDGCKAIIENFESKAKHLIPVAD